MFPFKPLYLEHIGERVKSLTLEINGEPQVFDLWAVSREALHRIPALKNLILPEVIYVVNSPIGRELLLGRQICDTPKFDMFQTVFCESLRMFMKSFPDALPPSGQILELIAMMGGLSTDIRTYNPRVFNGNPSPSTIYPRFKRYPDGNGNFEAKLLYGADCWFPGKKCIIFGDEVISSGCTGVGAINFVVERMMQFENCKPEIVVAPSPGASIYGISEMYKACQKHDIPSFIPICNTGIFAQAPDLTIFGAYPETILPMEFYEEFGRRYQYDLNQTPYCAFDDCGKSLFYPDLHLIRTLQGFGLDWDKDREDWSKWPLRIKSPEFHELLINGTQYFEAGEVRELPGSPEIFEYYRPVLEAA